MYGEGKCFLSVAVVILPRLLLLMFVDHEPARTSIVVRKMNIQKDFFVVHCSFIYIYMYSLMEC